MTQPLVSISLQTFNRGQSGYLREALEAILTQTYADFELLVIDNHSTDNTADIVLSYHDPRLTYLRLPPGGTPADSIRTAFRASRGDYLLTTHDDDIMEPVMLEKQMACIKAHPELVCLATNVSLMDGHGHLLQDCLYKMEAERLFAPGEYIQAYFEEKLWFPTPTLLFLREEVAARRRSFTHQHNAAYFPSGDIAGLFRLNVAGHVGLLAEPLLRYRQHTGQESRHVDQSAPLVAVSEYAETLIKAHRKHSCLRALAPAIHGFASRFRAQDALFRLHADELHQRLLALRTKWMKTVPPAARAVDAVLPFEILLGESEMGLTLPPAALACLFTQPAQSGSQLAYRHWTALLHAGKSPFTAHPGLRRIAILGSMLTAHLLVLAARRRGIEVAYCADSSPARNGKNVLGVPVVSPDHLLAQGGHIDAVILSNESDQEEGLRKLLQPAQEQWRFHVLSWKTLCQETADSP